MIFAVVYVLSGIAFMKLFRKVGVEPWAAWVPFFNNWRLLEVGGQEGFWAVLAIIPFVSYASAVFVGVSIHKIGASMGKDAGWTVLGIFFPFIWAWILGDDKAAYAPATMAARGWKPPLAGYGSARGPYVPPAA